MYVFPVREARRLPLIAGYGYHMTALATLLQQVDTYLEVPVLAQPKTRRQFSGNENADAVLPRQDAPRAVPASFHGWP